MTTPSLLDDDAQWAESYRNDIVIVQAASLKTRVAAGRIVSRVTVRFYDSVPDALEAHFMIEGKPRPKQGRSLVYHLYTADSVLSDEASIDIAICGESPDCFVVAESLLRDYVAVVYPTIPTRELERALGAIQERCLPAFQPFF